MVLNSSSSLDYWRNYFRTANSDIFNIIDRAILVAASDCPKEFRLRRDGIAERLFCSLFSRCSGCERMELRERDDGPEDDDADRGHKNRLNRDAYEMEAGGSKESKVNSSRDDRGELHTNQVSNYSFGDAEALTDEIEEESQNFDEVMRIKLILENKSEESDSAILDSLTRLQLMALTVDILKATEIGKAVNSIRRHGSKQISRLAQTLIDEWKELVDDWYSNTAAVQSVVGAEDTPDSKNPSIVDDEVGLPSPPMDEAFFATQPTSMELSQFFDGMDFDGNPRNRVEFMRKRENRRKPSTEDPTLPGRKQEGVKSEDMGAKEQENKPIRRQEEAARKPPSVKGGHERVEKQKPSNETRPQQKPGRGVVERKPDKLKCSDEASVQVKLEATKRRLQESYQQAEKAKKQRTIQVMELRDLPKQGVGHRNTHHRHWGNKGRKG